MRSLLRHARLASALAAAALSAAFVAAVPAQAHGATPRATTVVQTSTAKPKPPAPAPLRRADTVLGEPSADTAPLARRATRVTKVLVILVYWSRHDSVTPAQAKKAVITDANTWYRAASYGRQSLSGTATSWLKIPAPHHCGDIEPGTFTAAERAARRYNPSSYNRIVLYEPCSASGFIGIGNLPGSRVVLVKGGLNMPTAVHEQGHNYGLGHANVLLCHRGTTQTSFRTGSTCAIREYEDFSSAMSERWSTTYAGDFAAPQKAALGWLSGHMKTVSGSGTVTVNAYEQSGPADAIKVPGSSGRTYWIEYRTSRGNDTHIASAYKGVLIHLSQASTTTNTRLRQSQLLNAVPPKSGLTGVDAGAPPSYLPGGSSWTTPEGIRFRVASQSSGSASVQITRGQSMHAPGAVTGLTATALDGSAAISFHRAADNGDVISKYTITATNGGGTRTITSYSSSAVVSTKFTGLHNGTTYSFSVKASNEVGTGTSVSVGGIKPQILPPSVAITAPTSGSVSGVVKISASAAPNPTTKAKITELDFFADGDPIGTVKAATGTVSWDTGLQGTQLVGAHTLKVTAKDANGRTATTTKGVAVTATTGPRVTITSPPLNGFAGGNDVLITGTVQITHSTSSVQLALVFGSGSQQLQEGSISVSGLTVGAPPKPWSMHVDLFDDPPFHAAGVFAFTLQARDDSQRLSLTPYSLHLNEPTVTIQSPADQSSQLDKVSVTAQVANNSQTSEQLTVTLNSELGQLAQKSNVAAAAGAAPTVSFQNVDLATLPPGPHTFSVVATASGITSDPSAPASTHTYSVHFTPVVTITSPNEADFATGTTTVSGNVTNGAISGGTMQVVIKVGATVAGTKDVSVSSGATQPYSVDIDLGPFANGSAAVSATATDPQSVSSNPANATTHVVIYHNPGLHLATPAGGASIANTVHFTGTVDNNSAHDGLNLTVFDQTDGIQVGSMPITAAAGVQGVHFDVGVDVSGDVDGPRDFLVTVTDNVDPGTANSGTLSTTVVHPPDVTLTGPLEGSRVAGTVHFTGNVTNNSQGTGLAVEVDDGVTQVGTQALSTLSGAGDSFDVPVNVNALALGAHIFTVKVKNSVDAGETDAVVHLTVVLKVSAPLAGASVSGSTVHFTGQVFNASDTANLHLSIDSDDGKVADHNKPISVAVGATASFDLPEDVTQMVDGSHTFTLTVTDAHSVATTFTYALTVVHPPTLNVTAPTAGSTVSGSAVHFTGTVHNNSQVDGLTIEIDAGATQLAAAPVTAAAQADGTFDVTVDVTGLSNGSHSFTVKLRNSADAGETDATFSLTVTGN